MKEIKLTQGKVALVDDDAFDVLNRVKWYATYTHSNWYAVRNYRIGVRRQGREKMHHRIIGHPMPGFVTDHLDGNGLNNQRSNLSIVSHRGNNLNNTARRNKKTYSKFVGVTWDKRHNKWQSQITSNGQTKWLGRFDNEQQAGEAYKNAVAVLN